MLPTACIMTPIKTINNHNGQTDIYVTLTRMKDGAFAAEDSLLHTLFSFLFMSADKVCTAAGLCWGHFGRIWLLRPDEAANEM